MKKWEKKNTVEKKKNSRYVGGQGAIKYIQDSVEFRTGIDKSPSSLRLCKKNHTPQILGFLPQQSVRWWAWTTGTLPRATRACDNTTGVVLVGPPLVSSSNRSPH